jgi:hypothetical protein
LIELRGRGLITLSDEALEFVDEVWCDRRFIICWGSSSGEILRMGSTVSTTGLAANIFLRSLDLLSSRGNVILLSLHLS